MSLVGGCEDVRRDVARRRRRRHPAHAAPQARTATGIKYH